MTLKWSILYVFFVISVVFARKSGIRGHSESRGSSIPKDKFGHSITDEAFKLYGECVFLTSIDHRVRKANPDLTQRCLNVTRLQYLLPEVHIKQMWKEGQISRCMDTELYRLDKNKYTDVIYKYSDFKETPLDSKEFCSFIENSMVPLMCKASSNCPNHDVQQYIASYLASTYSMQTFYNPEVENLSYLFNYFGCEKTKIEVNPELYQLGFEYKTGFKILTNTIDCDSYGVAKETRNTRDSDGGMVWERGNGGGIHVVQEKDSGFGWQQNSNVNEGINMWQSNFGGGINMGQENNFGGIGGKVPEHQHKGYIDRVRREESVKFRTCARTESTRGNQNALNDCMKRSRLNALVPAANIDIWKKDVRIEKCSSNTKWSEEALEAFLAAKKEIPNFKPTEDYLTEDQFCHYIENLIIPWTCKALDECVQHGQQYIDAVVAQNFAYQQFAHGGVGFKFNCEKTNNVQINPILYNTTIVFSPNFKFLTQSIDCQNYDFEDVQKLEEFVPLKQRKGYNDRMRKEAEKKYGECMSRKHNIDPKHDCMSSSSLNTMLPAKYMTEIFPTFSDCIEEAEKNFERGPSYTKYDYLNDYLTQEEVCDLIDLSIQSLCVFSQNCPSQERSLFIDSRISFFYSFQQFVHGGKEIRFNCKNKSTIKINPELYTPGLKGSEIKQFLTKSIDCNEYLR